MKRLAIILAILVAPGTIPGATAPKVVHESGYRADHLFYDNEQSQWTFGEAHTTVHLSGPAHGWEWSAESGMRAPEGRLAFEDGDNFTGTVYANRRSFHNRVGLSSPDGAWEMQGAVRIREARADDFSGRLEVRPWSILTAGLEIGVQSTLPGVAELYYEGEGGRLDLISRATYSTLDLSIDLPLALALSSRSDWGTFQPGSPAADFDNPYQAALSGIYRYGDVQVIWAGVAQWEFTAGHRRLEVKARLDAYRDSRSFAHFGKTNLDGYEWSVGVTHHGWSLSAHAGSAEGELAGSAQAWPFVDGLARFLGERRHLIAEGELSWFRAQVSGEKSITPWLELGTRLDLAHVEPSARYVTWRPVALGMGIDDLQSGQLDITSADLARLSFSPTVHWRTIALSLHVSQIVPLHVADRDETDGDSGSGGDGTTATATDSRSPHQGFSLAAELQVGL
ncbi:hypothetical protein GF420_10630 [candidate division GN15 bacterium]|nr:hypothetical protein [candidate division GN15 bacterium]